MRVPEIKLKRQKAIDGLEKNPGLLRKDTGPLVLACRFAASTGFFLISLNILPTVSDGPLQTGLMVLEAPAGGPVPRPLPALWGEESQAIHL